MFKIISISILILSISFNQVQGERVALRSIPAVVAWSDCVVVGTVLRLEPKLINVPQGPGQLPQDHQIAIIKVEDAIIIPHKLTHLKVGYSTASGAGYDNGVGLLTKGRKVCLFLRSRPDEPFYSPVLDFEIIHSKRSDFKEKVAEAKKCVKLLEKPVKSLQSKKASERLLATMMLTLRYRAVSGNKLREVPIDAKESRCILKNLLELDWKNSKVGKWLTPQNAFLSLNLTGKDGWHSPPLNREFGRPPYSTAVEQAAKAWLKKQMDTYRIKKRVWVRE